MTPPPKAIAPATLPPAQPTYILRGHASSVNALHFYRDNTRLLSGDADGFVVLWDLTVKRPLVVWRAHEGSILGLGTWGEERIVTHGRDSSLRIWRLARSDQRSGEFSTALPVDDSSDATYRKQPWLLHEIKVSTLNFCSFASCVIPARRRTSPAHTSIAGEGKSRSSEPREGNAPEHDEDQGSDLQAKEDVSKQEDDEEQMIMAVPSAQDTDIILYALPSQSQIALIPAPSTNEANAGGRTGMVMALRIFSSPSSSSSTRSSTATTAASPSSQARDEDVREKSALHVVAGYENGLTALFRQIHASSFPSITSTPPNGRSSGAWQQIYTSRPSTQPILSLAPSPDLSAYYNSGADALIARHPLLLPSATSADADAKAVQPKTVDTRHAGQQSIVVRDDGRILATAGWDGRVRVYSARTMREMAVLKWHRVGVYSVAIGGVGGVDGGRGSEREEERETVARARETRTRSTHWLAAGGKDGKVSLWDVY